MLEINQLKVPKIGVSRLNLMALMGKLLWLNAVCFLR